jgi:hypothetical protein
MKKTDKPPLLLLWIVIGLAVLAMTPLYLTATLYPDKWTWVHTTWTITSAPWLVLVVAVMAVVYKPK